MIDSGIFIEIKKLLRESDFYAKWDNEEFSGLFVFSDDEYEIEKDKIYIKVTIRHSECREIDTDNDKKTYSVDYNYEIIDIYVDNPDVSYYDYKKMKNIIDNQF